MLEAWVFRYAVKGRILGELWGKSRGKCVESKPIPKQTSYDAAGYN